MADYSRPLKLGAEVTGISESALHRRLEDQHVTVSLTADSPGDVLTARVLVETLRRGPGHLHVMGEDETVLAQLVSAAQAIAPAGAHVSDRPRGISVHIGQASPSASDAIHVAADGYGVRLTRSAGCLPRERPANALGSVFAAAVAAGEVFKIAAAVLPERMIAHRELRFCPVALTDDLTAAPDLPGGLELDLMLVGLGAVGSAAALILGELPVKGAATLVDPELYAAENLATYSLGTIGDVRAMTAKVDLGAIALASWDVAVRQTLVEGVVQEIDDGTLPWPRSLLCGLDSVAARHAAQRLWPDVLIDAGTGDTALGIQEVRAAGQPCLTCLFPTPVSNQSASARLAELTGLPRSLLDRGDLPLTSQHIAGLSSAQREQLASFVGRPICGLADAYGLSAVASAGFRPSVPFVSQQAACLGVGRLLAIELGMTTSMNVFQFDALRGPTHATSLRRAGAPNCYCAERAPTITRIRRHRANHRSRTGSSR